MWFVLWAIIDLAIVALILFRVPRKPSERRPSTALKIFAFLAIGAGVVWIFSYPPRNFGRLAPFWFIRGWLDALRHPGDTNFWGLLNPLLYGSVFALGLIAGGAGLLRVRSWARSLFLYASVTAAVLAMITLIKFGGRMDDSLKAVTFLHIVAALGIVIFFMQKPVMQMFSEEIAEVESPQKTDQ